MGKSIIEVRDLSKSYRLGVIGATSLKDEVSRAWSRLRGKPISAVNPVRVPSGDRDRVDGETFWALRDVSFDVQPGEVLGIIGRNGAGKSTLLKILSRITQQTSGLIKLRGRVASLLEVGTGFHPDLTGRENIFLNGAILGMTKAEIQGKFDEILAFAEVEQFVDTPVKRYSSGMYVRLAFAVAAHLEPEILLIDEVLAVGDAAFQKKCLGKMGAAAKEGRTVLFVSHNMAAVGVLCPRTAWIDDGRLHRDGPSSEVIGDYLSESGPTTGSGEVDLRSWRDRYGNGEARIVSARMLDGDANETTVLRRTEPLVIEFIMDSNCTHDLHLSAVIMSESGNKVLHLAHHDSPHLALGVLRGRHLIQFRVQSLPLCSGLFSLTLGVHTSSLVPVDVVSGVLPFMVEDMVDSPRPYKTVSDHAFCWAPSDWSVTPCEAPERFPQSAG